MIEPRISDAPFLHLLYRDGQTLARGLDTCRVGRPLDLGRPFPDGAFAEWRWDGRQLIVRNDRYGLQPLFYWAGEDELGISTSLPRLLLEGAPLRLDEPALAVFIRAGYYVGEDTPFRAIRALPPNATLTWTAGRLDVQGGYPTIGTRVLSRDDAIDAYIPLLRSAVRARLPLVSDLVMPLSGGRDSRHLLLEIVEAGARPSTCLTVRHFAPRTDDDADLAGQVAAALGLPHQVLGQGEPRLAAEDRKNRATSFCSDEGTAFMALGDHLAGRAASVFDGIGGDFLSDGRFLTPKRQALAEASRWTELADALLWRRPLLPSLLDGDLGGRFSRTVAARRLRAELRRHADAASPISSYIFWNRCRREIATFPFNFYPTNVHVFCPYLDHDVFDFLISLPARVFMPPSFHAEVTQRAFPAYAQIPFESPTVRDDDEAMAPVRQSMREIDDSLDLQPPGIVSAEHARAWLRSYNPRGKETVTFLSQLMYVLGLDRMIAQARAAR